MARRRTDKVISSSKFVTIGELVRLTGIRYSTLKYYTECGLLPFFQEDTNLTRRYNRIDSIDRLDIIEELKKEGKSIAEIKSTLKSDK